MRSLRLILFEAMQGFPCRQIRSNQSSLGPPIGYGPTKYKLTVIGFWKLCTLNAIGTIKMESEQKDKRTILKFVWSEFSRVM